jgi:hypothetical protein
MALAGLGLVALASGAGIVHSKMSRRAGPSAREQLDAEIEGIAKEVEGQIQGVPADTQTPSSADVGPPPPVAVDAEPPPLGVPDPPADAPTSPAEELSDETLDRLFEQIPGSVAPPGEDALNLGARGREPAEGGGVTR